ARRASSARGADRWRRARLARGPAVPSLFIHSQSVNRGLDRAVRGLAEPADGRVLHRQPDLVEQRDLVLHAADRLLLRDPVQRLLLTHRADAAGHALAARLVAEERRDP